MIEGAYEIRGTKPGPKVAVFCGVHGNERAGIMAVDALRQSLFINAGTVVFVYANPPAIAEQKRLINLNLNRLFRRDMDGDTYEYARARELMDLLDTCDALMDLHSYRAPVLLERAIPFAICEANALAVAARLPIGTVVQGFSDVQVGGSDGYMYQRGKVGICVELGALECSERYVELGISAVKAFLAAVGCMDAVSGASQPQTTLTLQMMYKKTHPSFCLARPFVSFETVSAGELIAVENGLELRAHEASAILFPSNEGEVGVEMFLLAKAAGSSSQT